MFKKKMNIVFILVLSVKLFAFEMYDSFWIRSPEDVIKVDSQIGMKFNSSFQINKINDYIIDSDGWYKTMYCGAEMYVIFGSNYYIYHSNKVLFFSESEFNYGSSFYKTDNFDENIKNLFFYGYTKKESFDDYFPQIKSIIKSIEVPDVL